jgi:alpha-amylase
MKKLSLFVFSLMMIVPLQAKNVGVPAECEDVMLQAFYWNSYNGNESSTKYGRTKWIDLLADTAVINANFDVVWFPPSAGPTGNGVGYSAKQYSNQDSDWGTKQKLNQLITALHAGNTKVLADVVLNHRGSGNSWCTFLTDNFGGSYGSWTLTQKQIVSNDECFKNTSSNCYNAASSDRGAYDTGDNFDGARDLDHTGEMVQNWSKAYTQWLLGEMKYDGFRYDMTLGFHGRYLKMYNEAANPYISVSELWSGIDRQKQHLAETDSNTMIFDFQMKYSMKGIVNGSYGKLNKNKTFEGLRKHGLERYSVTFIDNHDTFDRGTAYGDNQYSSSDLTKATTKDQILQATAYQLMMPGIPCMFWPYWKSYQSETNELIAVRKRVGIHSESAVLEEESGQYKYSATVQGHRGKAIVRVGKYRSLEVPEGYELAVEGGERGAYTVFVKMENEGIETVNGDGLRVKGEKFVENGRLYIRVGEKVYDVLGRMVR